MCELQTNFVSLFFFESCTLHNTKQYLITESKQMFLYEANKFFNKENMVWFVWALRCESNGQGSSPAFSSYPWSTLSFGHVQSVFYYSTWFIFFYRRATCCAGGLSMNPCSPKSQLIRDKETVDINGRQTKREVTLRMRCAAQVRSECGGWPVPFALITSWEQHKTQGEGFMLFLAGSKEEADLTNSQS